MTISREEFNERLQVTATRVAVDESRVHLILDPVGGEPYTSVYSPDEARALAELLTAAADGLDP